MSVNDCVEELVQYVRDTRHDGRYTDDGIAKGVRDLVDDLLAEDQVGDDE